MLRMCSVNPLKSASIFALTKHYGGGSQMEDVEEDDKSHMSGSVTSLPEIYSTINWNEIHDECVSKVHQHIHTGERLYSCDQCEKRFIKKSQLTRHQHIHIRERPYSCDQCEKRFIRKSQLTQHQHIHTGEKPYSCIYCGKSFVQMAHQAVHQHNCRRKGLCHV
ncbi:zinc finger protein 233-like isoform X1 [Poeciliopsis prolifica]|uniref:zinc finger protein 233-like isoform X1 n=1 Tax=Poeciliopsis prolifica TaxID=188132 RepID=UPI002413C608|nr:zinc finger protein 233-like isoform X1 [Poeciliopsis prolifica]